MNPDLVATVAVVLTVVVAWPQAVRVHRTTPEGIPPLAVGGALLGAVIWSTHGVLGAHPAIAIANVSVVAAQLVIGAGLLRAGVMGRPAVVAGLAPVGLALAVSAVAYDRAWFLAVGSAAALLGGAAGIIRVARNPAEVEGVSAVSGAILTALSASWLVYGIQNGAPVVVAQQVLTLPVAAAMTVVTAVSHRRGSPRVAEAEADRLATTRRAEIG